MKATKTWCLYKLEERGGKQTKVPYRVNGQKLSTTNKRHWEDFEAVRTVAGVRPEYAGIGYVFDPANGLIGVDIDKCIDEHGVPSEIASKVLTSLGSYSEVSQSGTGIHIIVEGEKPAGTSCRSGKHGIEIYSEARFFVMTGQTFNGYQKIRRNQEILDKLIAFVGKNGNGASAPPAQVPMVIEAVELTDDDRLALAIAVGRDKQLEQLLREEGPAGFPSRSEADMSAASKLANAGFSADKIWAVIRESARMRDKWNRASYRNDTISKALKPRPPREPRGQDLDEPLAWDPTETGNRDRFLKEHRAVVRYHKAMRSWFLYDGKVFNEVGIGGARELMRKTIDGIEREALAEGDLKDRIRKLKWAAASRKRSVYDNALELAWSDPSVFRQPDAFDKDPQLINCQNGVLNLETLEMAPHSVDQHLTKIAHANYDPGARCPRWLAFLDKIMGGDQDMIAFLQRAAGYSLTGDTGADAFFILYGTGANGKSTFIEVMRRILNNYFTATPFSTFTIGYGDSSNDVAGLLGSRFVAASEGGESRRMDEERLKNITGGEVVSCRFLFKEYFSYKPTYKIWLSSNSRPNFRNYDEGIWRRIRLIPFDVTVPVGERVKNLAAKLFKEEADGIFTWAAAGAFAYYTLDGLGEPNKVEEATKEYRETSDVLGDFIRLHIIESPGSELSITEAHRVYSQMMSVEGQKPVAKHIFGKHMAHHGFKTEHTRAGNVYKGLALKDPATPFCVDKNTQ